MITIISEKIKTFNQTSYDFLLDSININQLQCSCGHYGTLTRHAYYKRNFKAPDGINVEVMVLRVKCSHCGKTHAILPDCVVPYSQISLSDHICIINNHLAGTPQDDVMDNNPLIDESNTAYILRCFYKYWKQRLAAFSISLKSDISTLINRCFTHFSRQFMQIKCTTNILYDATHIT